MRNRQLYKTIKQIVIDGNYTIAQVEGVTRRQMESIVGQSVGGYFEGIKENLVKELTAQDDTLRQSQIRNAIISQFPNAEFDKGTVRGKKFVRIWIDGKPEARN